MNPSHPMSSRWFAWRIWSRNLWIPILAHFFFNGIQVAGQYFAGDALDAIDATQTEQPYWVAGVGSLFLVILVGYYIKRYFALPEQQEGAENEQTI